MQIDWDDLRFFHAVAEHGSTKRAAAALRVDQTTCARRIASLEEAAGLALFERTARGYRLTQAGESLRPLAGDMERAANAIRQTLLQRARSRQAVLRLSVGDLLVEPVVQPALARFRAEWPQVRVDLAVETRYVDILNGEADVALRPGAAPEGANLIIRKLCANPMAVYCTQTYVDRHGMPASIREHLERPFACMEGRALSLISTLFPDRQPSFVASSLQPLVEAVASGQLAAVLPSIHADRLPGFLRCFAVEADTGSIWLVYHPRLKGQPHAQAFVRALTQAFAEWLRVPSQQDGAAMSGSPAALPGELA